jgi:hypothetical protein
MGPVVSMLRAANWSAIVGLTVIGGAVGACGVALAHYFVGPPLLATAFALLAAASAFTLDEPASSVVDVTPTLPAAQTAARSIALIVPLCGGFFLVLATALHPTTVPTSGMSVALIGNVLLGFTTASVARLRTGEPGVWASAAVVFLLVVPAMYVPVSSRVHTFPSTSSHGLSSNTWWEIATMTTLLIVAIAGRTDRAFQRTWRRSLPLRYPIDLAPSRDSRMMSAWPACCAVSAMMCKITRRADHRAPGSNHGLGGSD